MNGFELPSHTQAILHEAACHIDNAAIERNMPFVIYGARVFQDGNMWCAMLGGDFPNGVVAFGDTPAKAVAEFNKVWYQTVEQTYPKKST